MIKDNKNKSMMDTMYSFAEKTNTFFGTWKAIIILACIGTFFAILEIVLFFTGNIDINGLNFYNELGDVVNGAQLAVTIIAVVGSMISLYLGFFVGVANTRGSWYASYLSIAIMLLAIFLDVLAGLWLVVVELGIAIPVAYYRKNFWNKERYKEEKFKLSNFWPWLVLVAICSFILFFGIVALWGEKIYNTSLFSFMPPSNANRSYTWWLDATVATMGTMGNFCILFRWRLSYLWWTISKLPLITLFFVNGNYVQISQQFIFIAIDIGTVLAMTHQQKIHREKKQEA